MIIFAIFLGIMAICAWGAMTFIIFYREDEKDVEHLNQLFLDFHGEPRFVGFAVVRGSVICYDVASPHEKDICIALTSTDPIMGRWFHVVIGTKKIYLSEIADPTVVLISHRLGRKTRRRLADFLQKVDIPS